MANNNFQNILISGGSGFMGSHFVRYLYQKYPDYRIFNLDLLTYAGVNGNVRDIELHKLGFPPDEHRYHFIHGDVCDRELLEGLFRLYPFAAVINFAAESHVDRSIVDSLHFVRTNIQGVHTLIELVRANRVPKFIQISTDEIYGDVRDGFSTEESPIRPSNPYSASKAAGDILAQAFIRTHQVPAIIFRSSNNFGPYQYPEKLVPLTITGLLEGAKIPVHGTGEHVRSWIYVEDFCRGLDLVMHQAPLYTVWGVSGILKTNLEMIHAIAGLLGKDAREHILHTPDRPGADLRYAVDSTKIRRELGWQPVYDFERALSHTVEWYRQNPQWWQTIKQTPVFQLHHEKQSKAQYY